MFCCLQRKKRKKMGRLSEPQTPLSLWSPQTHTLYKYMIVYTDTQIFPPSPTTLLLYLLTKAVCRLYIVNTDTITSLGTPSTECWHRHTWGCAHYSWSQEVNNTLRGRKPPPYSLYINTTWHFQRDLKSKKLKPSPNTKNTSSHSCFLDKYH